MKKSILLLSFPLLFGLISISDSDEPTLFNFNGWEFLEWKMSKVDVENALIKKRITFDPGTPNQKQGPTTSFIYQGLDTRLAYDRNHLYDVQQHRYLNSKQGEEAELIYSNLKAELTLKYGPPVCEKEPEEENSKHFTWTTKYTHLSLYYNFDPENIDGFDDQTYVIYAQANEIK